MLTPDKLTNVFIIVKESVICFLIIYHYLYVNLRMIQILLIVCSGAQESLEYQITLVKRGISDIFILPPNLCSPKHLELFFRDIKLLTFFINFMPSFLHPIWDITFLIDIIDIHYTFMPLCIAACLPC